MHGKGYVAVTGASRGIGRATALEFARRGYTVFALARSQEDLAALAHDAGAAVIAIPMDIADEQSRQEAVEAMMAESGGHGLDVLINNAGYGQMGPLEDLPVEKLRYQLEVNVISLLAFTQPFIPQMRDRRFGRIVNLSSAAGRVATPFTGAYNASKFALEGMSDALRLELSPWNIRVILIEPGPIPTNFGAIAREEQAVRPDSAYEPFYRRYRSAHGGMNLFSRSPEAVARLIVRTVESENPRARYTITVPAKLAAFGRLVPDRMRDWAYRLALGLRSR